MAIPSDVPSAVTLPTLDRICSIFVVGLGLLVISLVRIQVSILIGLAVVQIELPIAILLEGLILWFLMDLCFVLLNNQDFLLLVLFSGFFLNPKSGNQIFHGQFL